MFKFSLMALCTITDILLAIIEIAIETTKLFTIHSKQHFVFASIIVCRILILILILNTFLVSGDSDTSFRTVILTKYNAISVVNSSGGDNFGSSIAVYDKWLIVGAPYTTENENDFWSGSAYIFEYDSNTNGSYSHNYRNKYNWSKTEGSKWKQVSKLIPSDRKTFAQFGYAVDINSKFAIVKFCNDACGAYIFKYNYNYNYSYNDNTIASGMNTSSNYKWIEMTKIIVSSYSCNYVSKGVYLFKNRDIAVIGNPENGIINVFMYEYNNLNETWNLIQILSTPNMTLDVDTKYDRCNLAISENENWLAVGAYLDTIDGKEKHGSVYVYKYNEDENVWVLNAQLVDNSANNDYGSQFGYSVAIKNNLMAIGTYDTFAIHVFEYSDRSSSGDGLNDSWNEVATISLPTISTSLAMTDEKLVIALGFQRKCYVVDYNYTVANQFEYNHNKYKELVSNDVYNDNFGHEVVIYDDNLFISQTVWWSYYIPASVLVYNLNAINVLTLWIDYDYSTSMDMKRIDDNYNYINDDHKLSNSVKNMSFSIDECTTDMDGDNNWQFQSSTIYEFNDFNGCFSITFSDCNDDVKNDRTSRHGNYQIMINNSIVVHGGYYYDSETNFVCTNQLQSYVNLCILPYSCTHNNNLVPYDQSNILIPSYKSMINSTITAQYDWVGSDFSCSGDHSCQRNVFEV